MKFPYITPLILTLLAFSTIASASAGAQSQKILPKNQYIENHAKQYLTQPYVLQRISENAYWVGVKFYAATVLVGKDEVLVIDPLSGGAGEQIIKAVQSITSKPITTLVYSHYHLDHVGDAKAFVEYAKKHDQKLNIVASQGTAQAIEFYGNKVPMPTQTISEPQGSFEFSGQTLEFYTPQKNGHSEDNSMILLKDEEVLHFVDMINPTELPYFNFALAQVLPNYVANLKAALALDWNRLVAGHGNIGSRQDVEFVQDYISDLYQAVEEVAPSVNFSQTAKGAKDGREMVENFEVEIANRVQDKIRSKYGKQYGFESTSKSHILDVIHAHHMY